MATKGGPRRDARAAKTSSIPDRGRTQQEGGLEYDANLFLLGPADPPPRPAPSRGLPSDGDIHPVEELSPRLRAEIARPLPNPPGVMVLREVGGDGTADGRRVYQEFQHLVGMRLPLVAAPDLARVRLDMMQSFPHAGPVLDGILGDMVGRNHVAMRPTLLVGSPGCGKTSFAMALLAALGVPSVTYPCGGAACAALAGAPRRWSTGEPCALVPLFIRHKVASPGLVLDELEKVASGKTNGSLHDGLLGMLEPSTRGAWVDPYLQAALDLSQVIWIATANSLDGIPQPLLERFRIARFPDPDAEHLPALASSLLRAAVKERGLDPRWALPLDGVELTALASAWRGGSIRKLGRLVEGVLAARDRAPGLC